MTAPLPFARHLELLATDADRVAAIDPAHLGGQVPAVDAWTTEGVIRHVGRVHRWVTAALGLPGDGDLGDLPPTEALPKGAACLGAYREAADALLDAFDGRDPAEPCPTFAGPGTVGWWARRQAQEVGVHRVDAQGAAASAGGPAPDPMAPDGAADGVDEWARFFLAIRFPQRFGDLPTELDGRTVHLHGTDEPEPAGGAEWLLTFRDGGVSVEDVHAKGDVALRGRAEDLLLALWRRRPLDTLEVFGDVAVAEAMLREAVF